VIATRYLRRAMHDIAARRGDFTLFALFMPTDAPFMRADSPGTWDLVVSAPWLQGSRLKAVREVVELLAKSIGRQAVQRFSRVDVIDGDDPLVRFILRSLPVEDGALRIESTDLMGFQIERAIIFRAWKPDVKKSASRELHPAAVGSSRGRG
jgi:hypothetical protein